MNIRDYWPDPAEGTFTNNLGLWMEFLVRRKSTYTGFTSLESKKGFLQPRASLHSPEGQEMVRLLSFRVLEELAESVESTDPDHIKEEAIDALNYLLAIPTLDMESFPPRDMAEMLYQTAKDVLTWNQPITIYSLGERTFDFGAKLGDALRNRAWMNNTQDPYFSGFALLKGIISSTTAQIISTCANFDEFCRFYIAKDEVLRFRLRSNY